MILAGIDDVKKIDHRVIASELPGEFGEAKLKAPPADPVSGSGCRRLAQGRS